MYGKQLFVLLAAAVLATDARSAGLSLPADLALVPADADTVVSVRLAKLWAGDCMKTARAMAALHEDELRQIFGVFPPEVERLTLFQRGRDTIVLVTTGRPTDRKQILRSFPAAVVQHRVAGKVCYRNEEDWSGIVFLTDHIVALGAVDAVETFARSAAVRTGPQAETLQLAAVHDLAVGMNRQGEIGLAALQKQLDAPFKEGSPLFQAKFAVLSADESKRSPNRFTMKATFRYESAAAAQSGAKAASELMGIARKVLAQVEAEWAKDDSGQSSVLKAVAAEMQNGLRDARSDVVREREVRLSLDLKARDMGISALPFLCRCHSVKLPETDAQMERLAKAVLAYHKDKGCLPPHTLFARDGKTALLSWRVLVLPYLGEEGKRLYRRFRLDEAWDSEHNIRLVREMPRVFAGDDEDNHATTHYQVLVGKETLFDGPRGRPLSDVSDGAANTILIAQGLHRVPWTKPQDLAYAADKPLPALGKDTPLPLMNVALASGRVIACAAPGCARTENGRIVWQPAEHFDEASLRARITRAGGQKVGRDAGKQVVPAAIPNPKPR